MFFENQYEFSNNIRNLLFKHSANLEFYDRIRLSFSSNNNYVLEIEEIYDKLGNINEYFGFTSFKGQSRLTEFEDKCIALYAKGMSLRDIEKTLKVIYKVKIGKDEISTLISAVSEETEKWRNRPLKSMYVFTYADCLYVSIKDDLTSSKKAIYVIIGVDVQGYKEVLGMWVDDSESAIF